MQIFKIASADDSDSIFEDPKDPIKPLRDVDDDFDSDEYGDQMDDNYDDEDDFANEMDSKPQKLPLETILEEDSIIKRATPPDYKKSSEAPKAKRMPIKSNSRERRKRPKKSPSKQGEWPEQT